ncbi:MAG: hypothetical protein ABI550_05480 [Ignavibacteriaceae bacterium]
MDSSDIHNIYFTSETRSYKIIRRFYSNYNDLFKNTLYPDFNDFLNQIFLNISRIDFNKEIKNKEAYIIGAIKIQCRVQLDKAIRAKKVTAESRLKKLPESEDEENITLKIIKFSPGPDDAFEAEEILNKINDFKLELKNNERELLNFLIDETPRAEIAEMQKLKINTLDTHIRRLRIKLFAFLSKNGYKFNRLEKFN